MGKFSSTESRDRYDELISEWLSRQGTDRVSLLVDDLALLYLEHAATYCRKNGRPTGEIVNVRIALRFVFDLHGRTRCREFGPKALKQVIQSMIKGGLCRQSINIHAGRIRRIFKWAAAEELVPESIWRSLKTVDGLRAGRTAARESLPVVSVPEATIESTIS